MLTVQGLGEQIVLISLLEGTLAQRRTLNKARVRAAHLTPTTSSLLRYHKHTWPDTSHRYVGSKFGSRTRVLSTKVSPTSGNGTQSLQQLAIPALMAQPSLVVVQWMTSVGYYPQPCLWTRSCLSHLLTLITDLSPAAASKLTNGAYETLGRVNVKWGMVGDPEVPQWLDMATCGNYASLNDYLSFVYVL